VQISVLEESVHDAMSVLEVFIVTAQVLKKPYIIIYVSIIFVNHTIPYPASFPTCAF